MNEQKNAPVSSQDEGSPVVPKTDENNNQNSTFEDQLTTYFTELSKDLEYKEMLQTLVAKGKAHPSYARRWVAESRQIFSKLVNIKHRLSKN